MIKDQYENLKGEEIFPYIKDEKYKNLLLRLMNSKLCSESDEFIISEALQIYANTNDVYLKVRILELLKTANL